MLGLSMHRRWQHVKAMKGAFLQAGSTQNKRGLFVAPVPELHKSSAYDLDTVPNYIVLPTAWFQR